MLDMESLCIEMPCELHSDKAELHSDKAKHFVWNAVDVSMIIIFQAHLLCEKPYSIMLHANYEPKTMLL